jgi:hypothetical protein
LRLFLPTVLALGATLLSSIAASANEPIPTVGLNAGTLGYGIVVERRLTRYVGFRVQNGMLTFSHNGTASDLNYNGNGRFNNVAALADFHPFGGGFRLTAGGLFGNDKLTATGTPTANSYTINGTTYSAAQVGTVNGTVTLGGAAPYFAIGTGSTSRHGLSFGFDAGVALRSPSASLTASNPNASALPGFSQNLATAQAQLQHDANVLRTYPVVNFAFAYKV